MKWIIVGADCPDCNGTGQRNGEECDMCQGSGSVGD